MMQINSYVSERHKKRKKRRIYFWSAAALAALYLLLVATQWFIFHSPIFRVDRIEVTGNNTVASADVITLIQSAADRNHSIFPGIFGFENMLMWPDQLSDSDLVSIPQIKSVAIAKDYFSHTITVNVSERVPFGIWCYESAAATKSAPDANAQCFWFDDTGVIFERSLDTQGNLITVVHDRSQAPRGLNQTVLSSDFVDNFISIMNALRETGLGIKEIDLNDIGLQEVDAVTTNGPTIYFSLRFPADNYYSVIKSLMAQPTFDKLQYIDCRTENRVYYK
jgi:hypothetical protein